MVDTNDFMHNSLMIGLYVHAADDKYSGKFDAVSPSGDGDLALKVTEKAKHYGIAAMLPRPLDPANGPVVLQYELKLTEPLECGGAYMKFVTADTSFTPSGLEESTPYTIMFGPDVCGATNKVHLIIRHENPKTKKIEEKHLNAPPMVPSDANVTHVFTAILYPNNNTYAVLVDGDEKNAGSLFEDFSPAFIPPKEIDDPEDKKPEDWVDESKIADPSATKPDDWDEDAPETIPDMDATMPDGWLEKESKEIDDPEATKPDDWDDEEDGDWEPPQIPNPKCSDAPGCGPWVRPTKPNPEYKGKWTAPLIDNPEYKGPWSPRKIANPDFFNDTAPLSHIGKIGAIAIEIWTMDQDYYFDNVVVSQSVEEAAKIRSELWEPKYKVEKAALKAKTDAEEKKREEEAAEAAKVENGFVRRVEKKFVEIVESFFDSDLVAPYASKQPISTIRSFMVESPMSAIAAISALIMLLLTMVVMPSVSSQAEAVKTGEAKKKDITPPDDDEDDDEKEDKKGEIEEEEEEEASPTRKSRRARRD